MNDGVNIARYIHPADPFCHGFHSSGCGTAVRSPDRPPTAASAIGSATAKPTILTTIWTTLTIADDFKPPAVKYAVTTAPPRAQPAARGRPTMASSRKAMPSSCPARIASVPTHNSAEIEPRTRRSNRHSRKSPTV